jgi:hypothetical protein
MSQNEIQIPRDYATWKQMITQGCGETLTQAFIDERIQVLGNSKDPFTQKFLEIYGEAYTQAVISWYERARHDMV